MEKKFSASDAASFGWEKVKENLGFFVLLSLVLAVTTIIVDGLTGVIQPDKFLAYTLGQLISLAVSGIITLGFAGIALKVIQGNEPKTDHFFDHLDKFVNWLFATIVMFVIIVIGLVLLIVPGIIAALRLQFYTYYIADKGMSAIDALKASWKDTSGQLGELFVWMLISIALVIIGALALVVGLLVTMPIIGLGAAWIYQKISATQTSAMTSEVPAQTSSEQANEQEPPTAV